MNNIDNIYDSLESEWLKKFIEGYIGKYKWLCENNYKAKAQTALADINYLKSRILPAVMVHTNYLDAELYRKVILVQEEALRIGCNGFNFYQPLKNDYDYMPNIGVYNETQNLIGGHGSITIEPQTVRIIDSALMLQKIYIVYQHF